VLRLLVILGKIPRKKGKKYLIFGPHKICPNLVFTASDAAAAISEITIETPNQQAGNAFGRREGAAKKKSHI
jgi:hypothetical protein